MKKLLKKSFWIALMCIAVYMIVPQPYDSIVYAFILVCVLYQSACFLHDLFQT